MLKKIILIFSLLGTMSFARVSVEILGVITEEDFSKVGVKREAILNVKKIIDKSKLKYEQFSVEKRSKELAIQELILEGVEKNWANIDKVFDEIGQIEAEILKDKIRAQYHVQKYISTSQYMAARNIALKRVAEQAEKQKLKMTKPKTK